jgi:predicted nucleotidyltransferase
MDALASIVEPIAPLLDLIRERYDPVQIWLFGSRARGDNREDSDWDLLAVVDDDTPDAMFAPDVVWHTLRLDRYRADVVLVPASEFAEDANTPNTLAWPVSREGRLLYER